MSSKAERLEANGEGRAWVGPSRPAFPSPNRKCTPSPFQLERSGWTLVSPGRGGMASDLWSPPGGSREGGELEDCRLASRDFSVPGETPV